MRPLSSSLHKIAKRTTHMALIMSALCIGSGSLSSHRALAQDCSGPDGYEGELRYNGDSRVLQYCDGTSWQATGVETEDVTDNLISRWRLNETSGTTATDSVSGHNGTLSGTMDAASDTEAGVDSTALSFNGSNDYILLPTTADFNIPTGGDFTLSAWVKTTDSYGPIIALRNTTSGLATLGMYVGYNGVTNNAGHVVPLMWYDNTPYSALKRFNSTEPINDGNWHHVVMVIDQSNNLFQTYIDGTAYSVAQPNDGEMTFATSLAIGAELQWIADNHGSSNTDKRFLEGTIDDVRFYQRALTASEISTLYSIAPSCVGITTDNLVAQWKLDETTGTTATDSVGSNNGAYNGFDATSTVAGIDGTAQYFDGTNDKISIADNSDFTFTSDFTLSAWIKHSGAAEASNGDGWRVISQQTTGANHFMMRVNDSSGGTNGTVGVSFYSGSVYGVNSTTNVKDGQWHHIVGVRQGSDLHIYIDGVLDNTTSSVSTGTIDVSGTVNIGNKPGNDEEKFSGAIDDVRVYQKALTSDEISDMYNIMSGNCVAGSRACASPLGVEGTMIFNTDDNVMQYCNGADWIAIGSANNGGVACTNPAGLPGEMLYEQVKKTPIYCEGDEWIAFGKNQNTLPLDSLVTWLTMDENSGSTLYDISGQSNDSSLTDPVNSIIDTESTTGLNGNSITLASGVDDYIQLESTTADHNVASGGGFSASVWVKTTDSYGPILALRHSSIAQPIIGINVGYNGVYTNAGHVLPIMRYNDSSGRKEFSATETINDGDWHHVVLVIDQANDLFSVYIDGTQYSIAQTNDGTITTLDYKTLGAELRWVADNNPAANNDYRYLDASFDELMIYNRVLTSAEITTIYNAHAP